MRSAKSKQPVGAGRRSVGELALAGEPRVDIRKRGGAPWALGAILALVGMVSCDQQGVTPAANSPSVSSSSAPAVRATTSVPAKAAEPGESAPPPVHLLPAPTTGASVTGRVSLIGKVPPTTPVPRGSDPYCARSSIPDEALLVDAQGDLGNVLVRVVEGAGGPYLPPTEPVTLTQSACRYHPRVLGAVRGQPVKVSNADATLHNVHVLLGQGTVLNQVQVDDAAPLIDLSPVVAAMKSNPLKLRCDVHPWMAAYLWVLDHPFFAVTAADGTFTLKNLAAGEYVLEAWHEQLGTRRLKLTIPPSTAAAAKPAHAEFRFTLETIAPSLKTGDAGKSAPPGG